jgi:hypothetical protein
MHSMSSTRAQGESGAVVVMVAALMPVIVLLLAFAVDTSHWWVHKAHLQTQVDAGVWAGAQGPWLPACDNTVIEQTARQYSGDYSGNYAGPDPTYNDQYSNETNVHVLVNSDKYESQGGTEYADGGTPCASFLDGEGGHLDLRVTESNLPNFLGSIPGFSVLPWTSDLANAHARVELFQLSSGSGYLPVAVPDPNPKAGAAIFIDEVTGDIASGNGPGGRAIAQLNRGALTTLNGKSLVEWATLPLDVNVREQTGVVIAFTGNPNSESDPSWLNGSLSEICARPLVECYEGLDTGSTNGLGFVHGFPMISNGVTLRDVFVTNSSCGDDSAPYFILNAGCTVGIQADVEFPAGATDEEVSVENADMGCSGQQPSGCALTLTGGFWTGDGVLSVPSQAGALDLRINYRYRLGSGSPISGGWVAQRVYSASDDPVLSGPVEYLRVVSPATDADKRSEETGCCKDFVVKVGLQGALEFQTDALAPPTRLRVIRSVAGNASQNQSLDCDPFYDAFLDREPDFADELWRGCRPAYKINTGEVCPDDRATLWASPQPWPCVAVQTGQATNKVPKGLNHRILGEEQPNQCPPAGEFGHNNWNLNGDSVPDYEPGDPRLLFTFVTPFGSFSGSGNTTVEVTNVAVFYITGWTGQGQGFNNPCQGAGDDPSPGPAFILGHFVKYAGPFQGGEGTDPCLYDPSNPENITPCVAVLTD